MKHTSVRFLELPIINLKELVVETYKVKLMFMPLPAVKISRQYTSPQQYVKLTLAESRFLCLPILIHLKKNEIHCEIMQLLVYSQCSPFPKRTYTCIHTHTHTYIHYVDPAVCRMAFGHEINHNAIKKHDYIKSHLSHITSRPYTLKVKAIITLYLMLII